MMKNILILVIALLSGIGTYVSCAEVCPESPACIPQLRVKNPAIDKLLNLLKEKKYKSYYKELCEFGTKNNRKIADDRDIDEEFRNFVWYYYLLANLPVFNSKLYMETESETYDYREFKEVFDLWLKLQKSSSLAGGITTLHDSNKIRESLKKQILTRTILSYYVCIISQFKNAYETNPWGERPSEDRLRLGIDVIFRQMPEEMQRTYFANSFINRRNSFVEFVVPSIEKQYMETLVYIFPGRYNDVKEYILKAGYTEDEIPGLIDRTVGRDASTDFLYRGKHRQENDKLLKKKAAQAAKASAAQ